MGFEGQIHNYPQPPEEGVPKKKPFIDPAPAKLEIRNDPLSQEEIAEDLELLRATPDARKAAEKAGFNLETGEFREEQAKQLKAGDNVEILSEEGEKEARVLSGFDQQTGEAIVKVDMGGGRQVEERLSQIELYALNRSEGETKRFSVNEWIQLRSRFKGDTEGSWKYTGEPLDFSKTMLTPEEARTFLKEKFIEIRDPRVSQAPNRLGSEHVRQQRLRKWRIALLGF